MTAVAVALAGIALVVALAGMGLVVAIMRQNGSTTADLRAHLRGHAEAYGHEHPRLDRRQVNLGAPRSTGERRRHRIDEPAEHVDPRDEPRLLTPELAALPTGELIPVDPRAQRIVDGSGATVWERGSSPYGRLDREPDPDDLPVDPATIEHAPPTAEQPAVGRPRVRP